MAIRFPGWIALLPVLAVFASGAQAQPTETPRLVTIQPGETIGVALDPANQIRNPALRGDALRAYLSRKTLPGGALPADESLHARWVAIKLGTVGIGGPPSPNTDPCSAGLCPSPLALADSLRAADTALKPPRWENAHKPAARPRDVTACHCVFLILSPRGQWLEVPTNIVLPPNAFTAPPGAAPWQAQIERPARVPGVAFALTWRSRLYCGGTLIAPQWVLTAAHCLTDAQAGVSDIVRGGYRVRLGVDDISNDGDGVSYAVTAAIPHPDYDATTYYNDIALLKIGPDARTAPNAKAWVQSLPLDAMTGQTGRFTGRDSFLYGWGLNERQEPSARLQIAVLRVQPDSACDRAGIALCALGIGAKPSAQCHGDSGGPLVTFPPGQPPLLIGVVSHNTGRTACGANARPGVFTRVAAFRPWIEQYTGALR